MGAWLRGAGSAAGEAALSFGGGRAEPPGASVGEARELSEGRSDEPAFSPHPWCRIKARSRSR